MTLQLKVGGTYRARNGDVVSIVSNYEEDQIYPYRSLIGSSYTASGQFCAGDLSEFDLIEETTTTTPSPASELDEAIAKFEREWDAAKGAMDKARWAAKGVIQAARKAGTNVQG